MTAPLLFHVAGSEPLARNLAILTGAEFGRLERRRFPDGETYLRVLTPVAGRPALLFCTLDRPDEKILPLLFAARTVRDLKATSVGLVCPYLAYMRQDRRFRPGEAVSSRYFAEILSDRIDWLVTVDPHLHRLGSLSDIYAVPATAVHAAPFIADWIRRHVDRPLLVGPDEESAQWAATVAQDVESPHIVLRKIRHGDRDIEVSVPNLDTWRGHTPVLVDDIAATGQTLIETVGHLLTAGLKPPVCIAVHGIFASSAYRALQAAGAARVVTTNTVPHESNTIDVAPLLADAVRAMLD